MLEFQNVSYAVDGGIEILKNINLCLDDRFVAITGPNGSGKSTMAKLIAGILLPTSGRILLDGVDITDMSITEISDASGFGTLRTFNRAFIKQMGVSPSDYKHSRKDDASVASIPQHHR